MESMPLLRNDFDHFCKLNEYQHQTIFTKLDVINTNLEKDLSLHTKRIEKIEKEVEKQKEARIYIIAIATTLAILVPILVQIFI